MLRIHPKDPEPRKIAEVVRCLEDGGVAIIPTDTVYAYVCSAHQARAIERITKLKAARPGKADLSLICSDLSQLSLYARGIATPAFRVMKRTLPGPYTFIVLASSEIPKLFKNNRRTVGIRVPDHPIPLAIVNALGHALAVASVHDDDPLQDHATDPERIAEEKGHLVDLVVDGGAGGFVGSTVVDLSGETPIILREGLGRLDLLD